MSTPNIVFFIPVFFGVIAICVIGCAVSHRHAESSRAAKHDRVLALSLETGIHQAAQARLQQESCIDRGEPVWFSHHVSHGQLRHWVLITHDSRYELRRAHQQNVPNNEVDVERGTGSNGWIRIGAGVGQYEYSITDRRIDNERVMAAITKFSDPKSIAFTSSLLGWTQMTKYEVDTIWVSMLENYGTYDILWNNCQHFLRNFASMIISAEAEDWQLFLLNASSSHQCSLQGALLSRLGSTAASLERLKAMRPHIEGPSRANLEENIRHLEMYIRKQEQRWASSKLVDLADASNENRSMIIKGDEEPFDSYEIMNALGELGSDIGDSGGSGDSGGGDGGDGGGGGD